MMATKLTKVQLENALKLAEAERDEAVKGLKDFKKQLPEVMKQKIDEYDLDICDSGLLDFANTLGIEWKTTRRGTLTTYITVSLPANKSTWGWDFDSNAVDKLEDAIKSALRTALEGYEDLDIDFDCVEDVD
jgi:hypothetical protein